MLRSSRYTLLRLLSLTLLAVLLMACAGGGSSSRSSAASQPSRPAGDAQQQDGELAAMVNEEPITLDEFLRERDRRAWGMDIPPADAAAFDAYVLQTMIEQLIIEQAAVGMEIEVTDDEVDDELEAQEAIAEEAGVTLEEFVEAQLYTLEEYREAQRSMLLVQKVSAAVINVPATTTQVHARHILVADEPTALTLLDQLNQGADFARLAQDYSLDKTTAPAGGDLQWVSRGDLLQMEVEQAIFSMAPYTRAAVPIRSNLGYHIVEVLERVEDRPLSESALAEKKQQAFVAWLQNQVALADIERYIGTGAQ